MNREIFKNVTPDPVGAKAGYQRTNMSQSQTPLTDAADKYTDCEGGLAFDDKGDWIDVEFARSLERQLAVMTKEKLDAYNQALMDVCILVPTFADEEDIAGVRAAILKLKKTL